jgi:hypothetical protein
MSLVLIVALLQVVVPAVLLAWLWQTRSVSRVTWLARTLLATLYCAGIAVVGVWGFVPWPVPYLYLILAAGAAARSHRSTAGAPALPDSPVSRAGLAASGLVAAAFAFVLVDALRGHLPPGEPAVSLAFPLRGGTFIVANGGNSTWINAHLGVKNRDYQGQNHAVDLLQLNGMGLRARGLQPRDLTQYAIFGTPVYAPCAGRVLRTENGAPDMTPPERDPKRIPGNFVLVECAGIHVVLAHFQRHSVRVGVGERVTTDTVLGVVGNSGNTDEPHLHVHAQTPGSADAFLGGEPLPVTFDGNYLVRNERVVRP